MISRFYLFKLYVYWQIVYAVPEQGWQEVLSIFDKDLPESNAYSSYIVGDIFNYFTTTVLPPVHFTSHQHYDSGYGGWTHPNA